MIADIEKEYNTYVCGIWQQLSDETTGVLEPERNFECMYNTVAVASNQFLQDKLEALGAEKS